MNFQSFNIAIIGCSFVEPFVSSWLNVYFVFMGMNFFLFSWKKNLLITSGDVLHPSSD